MVLVLGKTRCNLTLVKVSKVTEVTCHPCPYSTACPWLLQRSTGWVRLLLSLWANQGWAAQFLSKSHPPPGGSWEKAVRYFGTTNYTVPFRYSHFSLAIHCSHHTLPAHSSLTTLYFCTRTAYIICLATLGCRHFFSCLFLLHPPCLTWRRRCWPTELDSVGTLKLKDR